MSGTPARSLRSAGIALWPALLTIALWKLLQAVLTRGIPTASTSLTTALLLSAIAAVCAYLVVEVVLLDGNYRDIGLQSTGAARLTATGIVLGVALVCVLAAMFWFAGWYEPVELLHPAWWDVVGAAFMWACVGVAEEFVFRGMVMRRVAKAWGTAAAYAASTIAFGAAHLPATGGDVVEASLIGISGGLLFGSAYLATGTLWVPIGLHAGWNLAEGTLLGMSVSGSQHGSSLVAATLDGPGWAIGDSAGAEGGAVVLLVCTCAAASMEIWRRRRRHSAA